MYRIKWMYLAAVIFASIGAIPIEAKSLWTSDSPLNFMMADGNASKVGEILTIIVQEENKANDSADSQGARKHSMNGVLGMVFNNKFMQKVFGSADEAPSLKWDSSNQFEGDSAVDRSSTFQTRIAATVVRIDPAGNYLVEARKTLRVGEENKTIILSGKVRPRDIINNTVYSHQVADAEISYLGNGTLSKYNNPNIFQRFLNFLF
ncbi:MAG: flagellar basal body L-ring protein FlgH [Candidatus Omnitrophota bacterium]